MLFKKGGVNRVISYDEYLSRRFSKDSSEDEEFDFETPVELIDSPNE